MHSLFRSPKLVAPTQPRSLAIRAVLILLIGGLATNLLSGCKSASTVPSTDDASLTHAVQNKLATDGALSAEPIQASVQDAIATLNGTVSSEAARALAANDAAQVAGVKTVINNLTVGAPTPPPTNTAAVIAPTPAPERLEKPERHRKEKREQREQSIPQQAPPAQAYQPPPSVAAIAPPPPPTPPAPAFRTITLPADTILPVRLNQTLDSASTQTGEPFAGVLASDLVVDNLVVLSHGTPVSGRVSSVQEAAHFKGNSLLSIELTSIDRHGEHLTVTTDTFSKEGAGRGKNTAEKVGGGAAVGAILGGIFGGGKGAAIGAAAGGGAGAGVNAATRGQQVQIPAETLVRFRLTNPITLRVSTREQQRPDTSDLQHHDN
jgi:BON domain